ncbi:HmuY family protein [Flavobacterium notoginsengisoli]|uniref:HmuY family protein n=1 Tax=Flavobacterium notoginsengisoli TaxID=1478199 RepID=UPI00363D3C84
MKIKLKMYQVLKTFLLSFFSMMFLASCSSGDESSPAPDPDGGNPSETTNYYKVIRVENFGYTLADGNEYEDKTTLYYSLADNKEMGSEYRKTNRWDLAFSGLYSSFMSGNNGKDPGNFGAGTSASGGIYIVDKSFEEVTEIPAENLFKTGKEVYGTDENGAFGSGKGWYLYDFDGDLVRDGSYDNKHIAYALGTPLILKSGKTVAARTLILKTANGDYAKIKMISVYKNLFKREEFTRTAPKMYFTFEYVLIPKGSTKFEIKG